MKKVLSVILAALICLSAAVCAVPAIAADKPYPVIYVHGFMAGSIYSGLDTDSPKAVMAPEMEEITNAVKSKLPDIGKLLLTKNFDKFLDALIPTVKELVGDSFFDENGNAKPGTGREASVPDAASILKDYQAGEEIDFVYDWRYSPIDLARQLASFIETVKAVTGRDKVSISAHSYGNCVTMAYIALDENNIQNLDGYVANASAYLGESYTGELLTGDISILGDALVHFLKDNVFLGTEYEAAGNALCDYLQLTMFTDVLESNLSFSIKKMKPRVMSELLVEWFTFWPSIWAMVPDEAYASCRSYIFGDLLKGRDCSGLIAKLDEFDRIVREHKMEIVQKAGTIRHFGVVARYNLSKVPVTSNWQVMTDSNIDLRYATFGATSADYGKTLPDDYKQANYTDINYISPDHIIDASTCMFPEKTWFIKNMSHSVISKELNHFIKLILQTDGFTVHSTDRWQQYLIYSPKDKTITPYEKSKDIKPTFLSKVADFFSGIRTLIVKFFRSIDLIAKFG